jgi:hypothetical protein
MKRKSKSKREYFSPDDKKAVAEALDFDISTVRKVSNGDRNNERIMRALRKAKEERERTTERTITRLAKKF